MKWLLFLIIPVIGFLPKYKENMYGKPSIDEQVLLDVSYGAHPSQKMDIYLPADRAVTSTKVMVIIHGGSWTGGDKGAYSPYINTFKQLFPGYAFFYINYRLASGGATNIFPAQENDVKAAIQFIYDKRKEYLVSDNFILLGESAGGHLALLQAYKYNEPVKVKAVISLFAPVDLLTMYNKPLNNYIQPYMLRAIGKTPVQNPDVYTQSSPVNFITAQSPATLFFHGGKDQVVDPGQAIILKNKLQSAGVTFQYIPYANQGHGWAGLTLFDTFNKIQTFLSANVR